ncbi:hypothetical protein VPNG_07955 [Cytospora leucostoma]|uniref:Uncharacterized protein n=1 Tax=Cytospora leucostoma TaxID=1230097 RepID=A0A423WAU0_9PEZI|nr:hypothetical protein VPNG_07955 [Cytospora leucostoma]
MSAYIYVSFGERTVMMAKPATYQDLKRDIRTHFPMLGSVSSMVILWKDNGNTTGHWIEVVDSAYSVIPSGGELFVNVAEPITKRYIFTLPDGRNSNVGPLKQVPHGGGSSIRNNQTGQQVSINNKPKTSKHSYPGSESSFRFDRSVGAACASGWAVASERFRRSAKLIPNLEDCKEAVGLEVGESDCYPDEDGKSADNMSGHVQHQHYDACSRACTHECDCELCLQERGDTTVHNTDSAPGHAAGQHGEATAYNTPGKSFRYEHHDSYWGPSPDHVRPSGHATSPTPDLEPYEQSPRGWADLLTPHPISAWGPGDSTPQRDMGSSSPRPDYILESPRGSPGWPYPWRSRAGGGGLSGAHGKEDYADTQYAQTAAPLNNDDVQSASTTVPTSNNVQDSEHTDRYMACYRDAMNANLVEDADQTELTMADRRLLQQAQNQDLLDVIGMYHPAAQARLDFLNNRGLAQRLHDGGAGLNDGDSAEGPDHENVNGDGNGEDHWYASPQAASKRFSRRGGGGHRSGGGAMYSVKGTTNTSRQMEHYGWRLDKQGRDGSHRPEEW